MATESTIEPGVKPMSEYRELLTRIYMLDDDARRGLIVLIRPIITLLENGKGCSVTLVDPLGDGTLSVLALGNQALVPGIMYASAMIGETINRVPAGRMQ